MSSTTLNTNKSASLWQLFLTFLKIGAFTFGGGWAMIAIIQREIVENHRWIDKEDFLDLLAMVQSLPGVLAVSIAVAIGERLRGAAGCIVSALGTIIPSFLMILIIAIFLTPEMITSNPTLTSIFKGIRPAVVALIVAPVITSAKAAKIGWSTAWIPAVVALAIWSQLPFVSNPIIFIIIGALAGWWQVSRVRRETKGAEL